LTSHSITKKRTLSSTLRFNIIMSEKSKVKKNFDLELLGWVLGKARPYKTLFIWTVFIAVILAPISTIRPYLIKEMVDGYIMVNDLTGLQKMVFIYIGFVLANAILRYFFIYSAALLGQSVIKDLRIQVYKKISGFKLRFFDQTPIGTATTRTINDIEAINLVFEQGALTILADILAVFAVLGIMFYTSWRLTLICLLTLPFLIIASYIFKEKVKASFQSVRNEISKMNAFLQERISGMRIVQIFNAEKQEMEKFKEINRNYTQANLNAILYYAIFFPVVEFISALALALMIWLGAESYLEGTVSFGALVAFPIYLNLLFRPVRMLADKFNSLQMGLVAADRVKNILDANEHIKNYGTKHVDKLRGDVVFENVNFAYDDINFVLKDLSFTIKEGETLAIVGSTGSGKSSIINILNRFYEFQSGKITIGGVDIKKYELLSLRRRISIVLQDVFLFNGNVTDNITLRNDEISLETVKNAAETIGADKFIDNMPDGYNQKIMERGNNLSVGQRQLISFVRALVYDPDILILDEATSSIDTETEGIIQFAIEKLIQKRTSIIIAHRLSTIRHADKILVMDKGNMIEFGTHDELLQVQDGRYRELYEMQFVEQV
jgi:ATP-binding cassette subfamily B multidrug efflux pump